MLYVKSIRVKIVKKIIVDYIEKINNCVKEYLCQWIDTNKIILNFNILFAYRNRRGRGGPRRYSALYASVFF